MSRTCPTRSTPTGASGCSVERGGSSLLLDYNAAMSAYVLARHPDTPSVAIERVEADVVRDERGALRLCYRMLGDAHRVVAAPLAPGTRPQQRDELWRHTCCELFVQDVAGDGYYEYNFAPCGDWAAYRFSGYRTGRVSLETAAPHVVIECSPAALALTVTLADQPLDALSERRIGIACIVETPPAELSYWALAHPPGRPDFHHARAFALTPAFQHTADSMG